MQERINERVVAASTTANTRSAVDERARTEAAPSRDGILLHGGPGQDAADAGRGVLPAPASVEQERFVADLKQFIADIERLAGDARSLTGDGAAVARRELDRRIAHARRGFRDAREAAADRAGVLSDRAERYVRDNPRTAVAIALASGAAAVVLLAGRRR